MYICNGIKTQNNHDGTQQRTTQSINQANLVSMIKESSISCWMIECSNIDLIV